LKGLPDLVNDKENMVKDEDRADVGGREDGYGPRIFRDIVDIKKCYNGARDGQDTSPLCLVSGDARLANSSQAQNRQMGDLRSIVEASGRILNWSSTCSMQKTFQT
jgi:hypothetical protein